jgi:hypothetical protein
VLILAAIYAVKQLPVSHGQSKLQFLAIITAVFGSLLVSVDDDPQPSARGRHEFGLDLSEQTLNAKGAGLHGCSSARAQRLS